MNPIAEVRGARPPRAWLDAPSRPALSAGGGFQTGAQFPAAGVFREGAENSARGGRAPFSTSEIGMKATLRCASTAKGGTGFVARVINRAPSTFALPPNADNPRITS
jgi:hypothetical protein